MTREEAIQVLQTALTSPLIYGEYAESIDMAIEALSAEAVEVVRCMNCIYGEERIEDYRCGKLDEDWDIRFSPTHYCSFGERKEP